MAEQGLIKFVVLGQPNKTYNGYFVYDLLRTSYKKHEQIIRDILRDYREEYVDFLYDSDDLLGGHKQSFKYIIDKYKGGFVKNPQQTKARVISLYDPNTGTITDYDDDEVITNIRPIKTPY